MVKLNGFPKILGRIIRDARQLHVPIFLVGGAVRDYLLKKPILDIDIVAEGNPSKLVFRTAKRLRAEVKQYPDFGTFILELPGGGHIDFATARKETYAKPGALPKVTKSVLSEDLKRRDFTVNAMAVALTGQKTGLITDLFGGQKDLKAKTLRVLHDKSFRDDPTRILRLARFAARGFGVEKKTLGLLRKHKGYISNVAPERIREEIVGILGEVKPGEAFLLLGQWGILDKILPEISFGEDLSEKLDLVCTVQDRFVALLQSLDDKRARSVMDRLRLTRKMKSEVMSLRLGLKKPQILTGLDLIKLGYKPGPAFKKMLARINTGKFKDRQAAKSYLFDKFPRKR